MEDDIKKKYGRQPQQKNGRWPEPKMEDNLNFLKMEADLIFILMEDNLKNMQFQPTA